MKFRSLTGVVLAMGAALISAVPAAADSLPGDADLDGKVNVADIAMIASHIKGIRSMDKDNYAAADVNEDGNIDVTDISMIAAHIKGIKAIGSIDEPVINEPKGPEIVTKDGVTYVDGILIANKSYALPENYGNGNSYTSDNSYGLTPETYAAFCEMQSGAYRDGYSLWVCSGYRSYWYQSDLYWGYVNRDGQSEADTYSARPGHSEHQTGLALDINYADSWFDNTAEARWIAENCADYGFILRYPKGKEDKTGYMYESWHVRYVGKELARKVTDSGLCLEEYLGIDSYYH